MKYFTLFTYAILLSALNVYSQSKPVSLFDGKSFAGWEGDTVKTWRIENNSIIGGSLKETVPHNEFLSTSQGYEDFELTLE
ncbi:MAG TPA: family 16 glycoside hydrolase, partial [Puia sp.]|nr:family 16 glycoside hydrolase [Puia sp.]